MKQPLASVIILNWSRKKEVLALLAELAKQNFRDFETLVVDNHSTDDSLKTISQKFPRVKLIKLKKNYGKAGFNFGMRKAKGKYLVLFDNDALPSPTAVGSLVQKLKASPRLGLACPAVYIPKGEYFGPAYDPAEVKKGGVDILYFCGAGVGLKKTIFEKVGGFEERFFMCLEELEWATRVRQAGYQVKVFPEIKVINQQSVGGGDYRRRLGFFYTRNWVWYYAKYLPLSCWLSFLKEHLGSARYRIGQERSMKKTDILKGVAAGLWGMPGFIKERQVLSPSLIKELKQNVFADERKGWREGVSTYHEKASPLCRD